MFCSGTAMPAASSPFGDAPHRQLDRNDDDVQVDEIAGVHGVGNQLNFARMREDCFGDERPPVGDLVSSEFRRSRRLMNRSRVAGPSTSRT